jgi:hypothetical protein
MANIVFRIYQRVDIILPLHKGGGGRIIFCERFLIKSLQDRLEGMLYHFAFKDTATPPITVVREISEATGCLLSPQILLIARYNGRKGF